MSVTSGVAGRPSMGSTNNPVPSCHRRSRSSTAPGNPPWLRIECLIPSILRTRWGDDSWPLAKIALKRPQGAAEDPVRVGGGGIALRQVDVVPKRDIERALRVGK